ncbi:putative beta-lysine N-acetyltransferase [Desulfoscipio gibsoniae]|uniref:Putative beta-lysine N-acetyltransferase n=1 Tax=Desulfoscipio gibsoniae DSM 7213 TaxID=767817 RepID=R4KHJ8_9FIRM|nr:putative beta-lysine N-acetyltransferase [Desulfoscipio gibsoniae]AGL02074.1 putative beta-lysine N-acetyltransferase [Desulfoscipio gibsoniae DSM 7213]
MFAPQKQPVIFKESKDFTVNMLIDDFSKRAWVSDYAYGNAGSLTRFITDTCTAYGLEKIIFPAREEHYYDLKRQGFAMEGWIDGYLNGCTAYFLTAYLDDRRARSASLHKYLEQIQHITGRSKQNPAPLPPDHKFCTPSTRDIPALTSVFKQVFATYPSPVDQPDYLTAVLGKTALFKAVKHGQSIVSVAAAEVNWTNGNAEITNCATLPASRGAGFMLGIISELEKECLGKGIKCLYSLARASSYGMNLVFHRLGYRFRGTLINNCHISGGYEDMNIWVKYCC